MSVLEISFQAENPKNKNQVELGDLVTFTFTTPPQTATNVKVKIVEAPGTGDAVQTDRLIATITGQFSGGKFVPDSSNGDPLQLTPVENPKIEDLPHSTTPPVLQVKFRDGATTFNIPFPDTQEENGKYEVKLQVSGTVNGSTVNSTGQAILVLSLWRDVMIVPDTASATAAQKASGEFDIFNQNATFGEQWRKFAGSRRALLKIKIDGALTDFEALVNQAAPMAKFGDLILFVGHGVSGADTPGADSIFDTVPISVHGLSQHKTAITTTVLNLPSKATQGTDGKWTATQSGPATSTTAQAEVDAISPRYDMLQRIGKVLHVNSVARFIVVTCNIGADKDLLSNLAKALTTKVGGYDQFVATTWIDVNKYVQIWLDDTRTPPTPNPKQPSFNDPAPNDPPNPTSFHELPGGMVTRQP